MKRGRKLCVAFVDFERAFDSVRHDRLLECIRHQGVGGKLVSEPLDVFHNSRLSLVRVSFKTLMFSIVLLVCDSDAF